MDEAILAGETSVTVSRVHLGKMIAYSMVFAVLPDESKVLKAEPHGRSAYTQTARVDVELPGGEVKQYFLKV